MASERGDEMEQWPKYIVVMVGPRTQQIAHRASFTRPTEFNERPIYQLEPRKFRRVENALDEIDAREHQPETP